MKILVTGGAGFIGSALIRYLINETGHDVVNLDKLTYAGCLLNISSVADSPRYAFENADICDANAVAAVFDKHRPDAVMHLAAESHVDRSIDGPRTAVETNIMGTFVMLEAAREYWNALAMAAKAAFRFHHVSTDEVFGSLGTEGAFTEQSLYQPSSPYSASKAGADHLVRAWHETYGLPVMLTNCSNNYGPFQFPEKLIPGLITKALAGEPLPIYSKGENIRDWLYVDDHARALVMALEKGQVSESYNFGGAAEMTNIDVARAVCALLDELAPASDHRSHADLIEFVEDRPGHDLRYAIDWSKAERELGWRPEASFETGLRKTVTWYLENKSWCDAVREQGGSGGRLGLGADSKPG